MKSFLFLIIFPLKLNLVILMDDSYSYFADILKEEDEQESLNRSGIFQEPPILAEDTLTKSLSLKNSLSSYHPINIHPEERKVNPGFTSIHQSDGEQPSRQTVNLMEDYFGNPSEFDHYYPKRLKRQQAIIQKSFFSIIFNALNLWMQPVKSPVPN